MIGRIFCVSLTLICVIARTDACADGFVESGNYCLHAVLMNVNWAEARVYCEAMKAKLVTIDSNDKAICVQQYMDTIKGSGLVWIDGSDLYSEGQWSWMDSQKTFTFTFNWIPGQPNNGGGTENCVHINRSYGYQWNDHDCNAKLNFLCERPLPLNPY
ncbi:perlucin-like [Haliotis rubra]|uniref:perlucin-like n=1 Tax=Haliotis rubra TaxID=36100 RepID=UPI001EE557EA|nr:perlucin-like [Haliotis rubra]